MLEKGALSHGREETAGRSHPALQELLRRPAVSGREGEVARFAADVMTALGYDRVTTDSYGNVVGTMVFSGEGERVLLIFPDGSRGRGGCRRVVKVSLRRLHRG